MLTTSTTCRTELPPTQPRVCQARHYPRGRRWSGPVPRLLAWCTATGLAIGLAGGLAGCAGAPTNPVADATAAAARPASQRLHALFDDAWEDAMRRRPDWATYVGDNRFGALLPEASPAAEAAAYATQRRLLSALEAIDPAGLTAVDRSSRGVLMHQLQDDLQFEPLVGSRRLTLGAIRGFHTDLTSLLQASPVNTAAQAEQVLARLAAYPRRVDQELDFLREGIALGWVAAAPVVQRVLATLDVQLAAGSTDNSPFFEPFTRLHRDIAPDRQADLQARARALLAAQVLPAQQRLRDFVAGPYAAAAPASGGMGHYPGGATVYAAQVRSHTTTDLTPQQIHAIGLREVARLQGDIAQVMREMAWPGDFASFVQHLNTDPRYFHTSPEAMLDGSRALGKRIDAELPRLFAELPRTPWGVRAMPEAAGPDAAETYSWPPLDGSRPGWFNANVLGYKKRPVWSMEAKIAHEGVPGHHLQSARAMELGALPTFRRAAGFTAYSEGWALYAETLGQDLGLYNTPPSRFGFLQGQIWRAARLVVDTGIHDQGWSRQRAIDYLRGVTGIDEAIVSSEVDRYTSIPGQALSYMVGQLKIIALRDRARAALGERFDIRRFHNALLDQGALPLAVLERQIDDWIATEQAKPAPATR